MNEIATNQSHARTPGSTRQRVTCWAALLLAVSACSGRAAVGTGNTNWVVECESTNECSGELTCQCNLCGPTCDGTLTCGDSGEKPVCDDSQGSGGAGNGGAGNGSASNDSGGAGNASGSSPGGSSSVDCTAFPEGAQTPVPTSSTFQRVEPASQVDRLLVDGDALYWFDLDGQLSTMGLGKLGSAEEVNPIAMRAAPEEPWALTGPLFANDAFVFWTEAPRPPEGGLPEPSFPGPPGRLYMIAKPNPDPNVFVAQAEPQLVFEDPESVIYLVGVAGDQAFFRSDYADAPLYAVTVANPEPRAIAADLPQGAGASAPSPVQIDAGVIYWAVQGEDFTDVNGYLLDLYRTDLDGNDPVLVTQVKGEFRARGERVVWQEERLIQDPLVLDQNFVTLDQGTGCAGTLPNVGESIQSWLFDDQYAYWYSYNALGSVDNSTGTGGESSGGESSGLGKSPLLRVNLDTGAVEEIVVPGFDGMTATDHLLGQNDSHLFVYGSIGLVAVDKTPREGNCVWGVDNLLGHVGVAASPRQDCGTFTGAVGGTAVSEALACLRAAPNDTGAQFSVNESCDGCLSATYVKDTSGILYRVTQTLTSASTETNPRFVNVERCESIDDAGGGLLGCLSENLYLCR